MAPPRASIRPRLGDRGKRPLPWPPPSPTSSFNSATAGRPWKTSIRPSALRLSISLQFGHGWATVENDVELVEEEEHPKRLQFGHGWATVENLLSPGMVQLKGPCFNSATAGRPWKTRLASARGGWRRRCFNSATAGRPWKTTTGTWAGKRGISLQ